MTPPIPTCEPSQIVAGDTAAWTKALDDYQPGDGWTLKYRLVGGAVASTVTADTTTYPGLYFVTIAAAVTAAVVADTPMRLIGWVENGDASQRHTIFDGVIGVLPNAATATATNLLTHEERVLSAIEAVLEGRATSDIEAYSIAGRSVTKMTFEDLLRWRGIYLARVARQRHPSKLGPTHRLQFNAAS